MVAFTVTLTNANTNYNLLALVRAVDANYIDKARSIQIQADDDGGAQKFRVGDDALTDTRYGYMLRAGDYGPDVNAGGAEVVGLLGAYARCDTAGKKLCIHIWR